MEFPNTDAVSTEQFKVVATSLDSLIERLSAPAMDARLTDKQAAQMLGMCRMAWLRWHSLYSINREDEMFVEQRRECLWKLEFKHAVAVRQLIEV